MNGRVRSRGTYRGTREPHSGTRKTGRTGKPGIGGVDTMRETSLEAFESVKPYLSDSRQKAFEGVLIYRRQNDRWPTGPEVHELLINLEMVDIGFQTKSRLTELKQNGAIEEHELREHGHKAWKLRPTNPVVRRKVVSND